MKLLTRLLGPRTLQREDGVVFTIGEKVHHDTEQGPTGVILGFRGEDTALVRLEGEIPYTGEALINVEDLVKTAPQEELPAYEADDAPVLGADVFTPTGSAATPMWPVRFPTGAYIKVVVRSESLWAVVADDDGVIIRAALANDHAGGRAVSGDPVELIRACAHAYVAPEQVHRLFQD